jgi:hypothetical protein
MLFHTRNVSTEKGEPMRLFASIPAVTIATWAVLSGGAPLAGQAKDSPSISITGVPPAGSGGPAQTESISGKATGVDFREHRIVIYAFASNAVWYVQPTTESPLTLIDTKGNWEIETHLGRAYAALLVKKSFKAKPTLDALPDVGGDVRAVDTVAGKR